jgi:hypothetical protein
VNDVLRSKVCAVDAILVTQESRGLRGEGRAWYGRVVASLVSRRALFRSLAVLAAAAAGLLAVVPATPSAASGGGTVFTHSAKSTEFEGGRLILRGADPHVSWASSGGRSGAVSIALLHRRLFAPGMPPATGVLHIAGQRAARDVSLKLSRPRYYASRRTVSYSVTRLGNGAAPSRVARAAQQSPTGQSGPATVSIIGDSSVIGGEYGGNDCDTTIENDTTWDLQAIASSNWSTDTWDPSIPPGFALYASSGPDYFEWRSAGGLFRGCSASAVWQVQDFDGNPLANITLNTTYTWDGSPSYTCTSSNPTWLCTQVASNSSGFVAWAADLNRS